MAKKRDAEDLPLYNIPRLCLAIKNVCCFILLFVKYETTLLFRLHCTNAHVGEISLEGFLSDGTKNTSLAFANKMTWLNVLERALRKETFKADFSHVPRMQAENLNEGTHKQTWSRVNVVILNGRKSAYENHMLQIMPQTNPNNTHH